MVYNHSLPLSPCLAPGHAATIEPPGYALLYEGLLENVDGSEGLVERVPHTSHPPKGNFHSRLAAAKAARDEDANSPPSDVGKKPPVYVSVAVPTGSEGREKALDRARVDARRKVRVEYDVSDVLLPLRPGTMAARFLGYCAKDEETGCWNWRGQFNKYGKPCMGFMRSQMEARRLAYELFAGNTHHWNRFTMDCDNHSCVNPNHMRRYKIHADDMEHGPSEAAKKAYRIEAVRKLDQTDVDTIRASFLKPTELAERYGVSRWTIWSIKSGRRWKQRHHGEGPMLRENAEQRLKRDRISLIMQTARLLQDVEATSIAAEKINLDRELIRPVDEDED